MAISSKTVKEQVAKVQSFNENGKNLCDLNPDESLKP